MPPCLVKDRTEIDRHGNPHRTSQAPSSRSCAHVVNNIAPATARFVPSRPWRPICRGEIGGAGTGTASRWPGQDTWRSIRDPSLRVDPAHACEDRQTKPRTAWRLSYEQALRSALANGFMTDVTPSPAATAPDPVSIDIVRRPGGQPLAAQRLYRANFSVRWAGPTYSLSGRINSLDAVCSMMCAVHPVIRLITKIGVKEPISNPIKW